MTDPRSFSAWPDEYWDQVQQHLSLIRDPANRQIFLAKVAGECGRRYVNAQPADGPHALKVISELVKAIDRVTNVPQPAPEESWPRLLSMN